jgi:hypothetical protein
LGDAAVDPLRKYHCRLAEMSKRQAKMVQLVGLWLWYEKN